MLETKYPSWKYVRTYICMKNISLKKEFWKNKNGFHFLKKIIPKIFYEFTSHVKKKRSFYRFARKKKGVLSDLTCAFVKWYPSSWYGVLLYVDTYMDSFVSKYVGDFELEQYNYAIK